VALPLKPVRLLLVALLLAAGCARPGGEASDVRRVTIVDVSDWHGQLEPLAVTIGGRARPVGGAAALKTYFDRERGRNPGGTLVVTAGDAFSATPPLSSFFEDVPAVEAQNLMGVDIDTLGNHNFDDVVQRVVVRKIATLKRPWADEVPPDPAVQAMIDRYRAAIRPLFDRTVGEAALVLTRSRQEESLLGNFETDTLRATYGTRLAFDVSGALRDDIPSSYLPADARLRRPGPGYAAGPPWDLVEGDFHTVFPFHNVAVTFRISGQTLWQALENSVSQGTLTGGRFVSGVGRFLQISGFRYRFDPRRPPGRRVVAVTLDDGTLLFRDATVYTAVTSDFVFNGGDGYTMLETVGVGVTRELIAETMSRAVRRRGSASARIEGRITAAGMDSGRLSAPALRLGAPVGDGP
jgi:2',3'-cyclic-nucleotide 2'-phosphodiesterase (5'-nucleotidase family)